MRFELSVDVDNDEFAGRKLESGIARMLAEISKSIRGGSLRLPRGSGSWPIRDINGNRIGNMTLTDDDAPPHRSGGLDAAYRATSTRPAAHAGAGRHITAEELFAAMTKLRGMVKRKGHNLAAWGSDNVFSYAECKKCGDSVTVRRADGTADGTALTEFCPESSKGP